MKEILFDKYWTNFWIWLSVSLILIIVLVVLFIFRNVILIDKTNIKKTRIIRLILFASLSVFLIFSFIRFSLLSLDLSIVYSNNYEVFEGEFVGYTRYVESNTPEKPRGKNPIFKNIDSNEELILTGSQDYVVGEMYIIYYLPNSMVNVVEKASEVE
jgi:glucan phosphoethanolaminetransferase (alkaline phosphatase superfamily)